MASTVTAQEKLCEAFHRIPRDGVRYPRDRQCVTKTPFELSSRDVVQETGGVGNDVVS